MIGTLLWFRESGSESECKVVEGDAEPVLDRDVGGDVVVAAAEVLDEGMSGGKDPRGAVAP